MGLGLPIIVDIAISLVFTYFTLSLFASEVQNILKALLQWRAVHLKESIEGMLVGNDSSKLQEARVLVNQLYNHPLIRSLTHQTKGEIADVIRQPMRQATKLVQTDVSKRIFGGHNSGPSHLPVTAFSGSLLSTFDFVGIYRQLLAFRLKITLQGMVSNPEDYQNKLAFKIDAILATFKSKQISLATAVQNIAVEITKNKSLIASEVFQEDFSSPEAIESFTHKMQLSIADTIRAVRQYLQLKEADLDNIVKSLDKNPTFEQAKSALATFHQENPVLDGILSPATDQSFLALSLIVMNPPIQKLIKALPPIPQALGDNLEHLATNALDKVDDLAQEANQFEQEIATWFNHSMERAYGVYQRNSRLVAIAISITIAIIANADSFYMMDRFAKEKTIAASVIGVMDQLPEDALEQTDRINQLSSELSLPIGWQAPVLEKQADFRIVPLNVLPFWVERIPGWIVTGIAVSMGSSFWYDLLKKLIDVDKAGQQSTTGTASATKS
ncbi:hypothetical protein IQ260_23520 [Leptolyngbya cf. ectocarpi LEGE 11479]|uniref:Uncharacterized protein n=1 Tax=Leptolyngbya cf. ectocarpi LEGE 11479 TaxID=1828722 RepID=A0A928ZY35_LEPEC|nr:hypothetical protein [Leptolyngbya ectocarpi]MBE9069619.1 hypothetical protein [Leptolyngbya cf. ectocarpi LEGE 11479]